MLAEPIAQKNPPPQWATPNRPLCGGAPPPPMWATPHRLRRGRIGHFSETLHAARKTAFLASTSLMSTLATDAERMDAANEHTVDKHATNATAKDLPNAAEPTHGFRSVERLQGPEAQGCKIPAGQCRVCIHCCGAH